MRHVSGKRNDRGGVECGMITNGLIAKRVADAIQDHGADSGAEHMVGDIEDVVFAALSVMREDQKSAFLAHEDVRSVFESAGHERQLNDMRGTGRVKR